MFCKICISLKQDNGLLNEEQNTGETIPVLNSTNERLLRMIADGSTASAFILQYLLDRSY
jgi:hypothetical protein